MIHSIKQKIRSLANSKRNLLRLYRRLNHANALLTKWVPDEVYAKIKYKENTGESLNIKSPTTFNEKLWWLKLNNRDPLMTTCSDKISVRDYVKQMGYESILNEAVGFYEKPEEIPFKNLNGKFS